MYRSDKQFMKNPATAPSRIYVGNIAETVVAADLEDKFSNHGNILGLVLQRGFGFIQYEMDDQAQAAIRSEHGTMFHNRKLNVRQAVDKTRMNNAPQSGPQQTSAASASPAHQPSSAPKPAQGPKPLLQTPILPPPKQEQQQQQPEEMDTTTGNDFADNQGDKQSENEPDSQNRSIDGSSDTSERRSGGRRGGINQNNRSRERDRHRDHDRYPRDDFNNMRDMPTRDIAPRDMPPRGMAPRDMPPRDMPPRDMPPRDMPPRDMPPRDMPPRDMPLRDMPPRDMPLRDMPPRDMPLRDMPPRDGPPRDIPLYYGREDTYRPGFVPPPIIERPDRNDCEIIVVSRLLTEYAEYIEKRLKGVGLVVDLLFPNEDVPLGRVLANISSRGCLYAILVMPQNEEYRSLTLSILHGIPQEHRNMPVEDAIILLTRNFDAYMRGDKSTSTAAAGGASLTDRHPEPIQMLLNLLAENRQITAVQYDRLVKYLQDRRELQSQYEITEGGGDNMELEPNSKQAELQSRIMNILNKSADESPKPVEAPIPPPPGPTPLLNDPSVQKALDSLLLGDMFKTISSGF